ncbi:MAG: DUF3465 domain-containing protein [Steroidobacteraceae bacterium]
MKKILALVGLLLVVWFARNEFAGQRPDTASPSATTVEADAGAEAIAKAFEQQAGNVEVTGAGVVVKVLPDDTSGSPHQRFLLELPSGQTVLVAHNIDLAPRVPDLSTGDTVEFHGIYEWNPKGGVIHWTHGDPAGHHEAGWLRHDGQTYQ